MGFKNWFIIVILQIGLVALGLFLYHLFLGGTGIEPGDALTIWATVITIVFIVFSVLGLMNIDGKITELKASQKDYEKLQEKSKQLLATMETSRSELIQKAQDEINRIVRNSSEIQNYYQRFAAVEAVPAPDKKVAMYTDIMSNYTPVEGLDKAFPYIKRGSAYMQLGLLDKAKADFEFALANCMDINKSTAYACLADYYVRIKDYPKSIEYYKLALEKNSSSAPLCMDLANSLNATQQYDEAAKYYDMALAINPEMAEIYFNKATRLRHTITNPTVAENDQMLAYLDKCLSFNPYFYKAYINKAAILRSQGKEDEAAEVLNNILSPAFDPEFLQGIEQRGIALRLTGDFPKALNDFNFVLFYNPHDVQNLCNLALTHFSMYNIREADYYVDLGLAEAERQNNHSCDGDFHMVRQMIINFQNRGPFAPPQTPKA